MSLRFLARVVVVAVCWCSSLRPCFLFVCGTKDSDFRCWLGKECLFRLPLAATVAVKVRVLQAFFFAGEIDEELLLIQKRVSYL